MIDEARWVLEDPEGRIMAELPSDRTRDGWVVTVSADVTARMTPGDYRLLYQLPLDTDTTTVALPGGIVEWQQGEHGDVLTIAEWVEPPT